MSRRAIVTKAREVQPDPLCGSQLISRMVNVMMVSGKKFLAQRIIYGPLATLARDVEQGKLKLSAFERHGEEGDQEGGSSSGGGGYSSRSGEPQAIKADVNHPYVHILAEVLNNIGPYVEVKPRRVGGATYQIPVTVTLTRRIALAMRWLVDAARARGTGGMQEGLLHEMRDSLDGRGAAVKKREDMHKMAKANQTFAHIRV